MNYFDPQDFDIFKNAGQPRNQLLEANYKKVLDKFKNLVSGIINKLGSSYGCSMDISCLSTPGKYTTQTLIGYKWARIYINNYQGVINPDTGKKRIQNVFGLSISINGLSIRVDKNGNQVLQTQIGNQTESFKAIHDRTEMFIKNADEKTLVDDICQYITSHENEYLENGALLGIKECIEKRNMNIIRDLILTNKNLILSGAPGTGKTYLAKEMAKAMTGDNDENNHPHYEMVQFHPSYDYSDFVEGLRPVKDATGNIGFERRDGVFKSFCKKALNEGYTKTDNGWEYKGEEAPKYVFIIDEINRGEMSKIFGELFFSIDPGYRGTKGRIKTQYQNLVDNEYDEKGQKTNEPDLFADGFFVPKNVYIIGTMNDIDRSVESMDFAMRRRFAFKEVKAIDRIDMWDGEIDLNKQEAGYRMKSLNKAIELIPGLSRAYHIGPSYFLKLKDNGGDFADLWNTHLEGLLFEYLRGMPDAEELRKKLYIVYNDAQDKELSDDDIKKIMGV